MIKLILKKILIELKKIHKEFKKEKILRAVKKVLLIQNMNLNNAQVLLRIGN
jgi:hypothetical protein